MEAPLPPSPASRIDDDVVVLGNENGLGGAGDGAAAASVATAGPCGVSGGVWSDGVLDVVALLGKGTSGAVQAVQDKRCKCGPGWPLREVPHQGDPGALKKNWSAMKKRNRVVHTHGFAPSLPLLASNLNDGGGVHSLFGLGAC